MVHQKARGEPHRRRLAELLMAPGRVVPAGTDQIAAQGGDELLANLGGGGHAGIVARHGRKGSPAFMAFYGWVIIIGPGTKL
jgi:hypothetical protein